MKMADVRQRAKAMGLKTNGSKADVIHRIQAAENNEQCFGSNKVTCAEDGCCWRDDCRPATTVQ